MAKKYDLITDLYAQSIREVTATPENWLAFLRSACRNFRLPFDEQILIHVQRPEASAVLSMEDWNLKFGRWVKHNSSAIAVFDKSGNNMKLKYYFDVSDTKEGKYKRLIRPVALWKVTEENQEVVKETLSNAFGVVENVTELSEIILSAAEHLAEDNLLDYMQDILAYRKDSFIEELDEYNVEVEVRTLLSNSIAYMLMVRCGIDTEDYLETEDFRNIRDFNTPELVNLFGTATSDVSEMALAEISDTMRKLQQEQNRKNRTFAGHQEELYTGDERTEKITSERGFEHESSDIQQARRLFDSESDRTGRAGRTRWEVWLPSQGVSERESLRTVHQPDDTRETETALDGDTRNSTEPDGADYNRDESGTERDRGTESERSDDVGGTDEQYPSVSGGNRDEGTDLRLGWYDRSHEDKSLPFFHNDEDIKELLLTTPHLKAEKAEIQSFFKNTEDSDRRKEYIKNIFNSEYTEIYLEDGRRVGYKTYQNVLHLWEGSYLSRTAQGYYDWGVIADYFEGMRLMGELRDKAEPLPTVNGQLAFLDDLAEEKSSAFSIPQEIIDYTLRNGSGFSEGKFRIYSFFLQGHTTKEKVAFLKDEYGTGGHHPVLIGTGIGEDHDAKGLKLYRGFGEDTEQVLLKWENVAKRIDELITADRYMSQKELAYIPEYEKGVIANGIYHFYTNQPEHVVRPYESGLYITDAIKAIRPQLNNPERVEELLTGMSEVLENTADFDRHYASMQRAFQQLRDYHDGVFSLFTPIPAEKEEAPSSALVESAVEQVGNLPSMNQLYDFGVDMVVHIGMDAYEIVTLSDDVVVLRNQMYPLFTEEMPRQEFERKVVENPANDHLKKKMEIPEVEELQEEQKVEQDIEVKGGIAHRNYLSLMELAPEVLCGERDSMEFHAGEHFMPLTVEWVGEHWLSMSHYFEQNGDSLPDPDMEFMVDHEKQELHARTYDSAYQKYFQDVTQEGGSIDERLEEELDEFAGRWLATIREQGYKPFQELDLPAEKEISPDLSPAWEKSMPKGKVQTFDLHPEIPQSQRHQFQIADDTLGQGGAKEKFRANIMAIQLLKKCEKENRYATPEEQEILSGYVGWGGLSDAFDETKSSWGIEYLELKTVLTEEEYEAARQSTLTAFYTPPVVIRSMYQALENMGLKSGNIVEPSCGIGNFIGMKPESLSDCKVYGVEIDSISGRIAAQLYQKSTIAVQGYEEVNLPDSFFDVAIGNVPFGQFKVLDKRYDKNNFLIHDYFFAKTLDKVRPGGVIAFITSSGTMDKSNPAIRKYIAQRAELIGAIRLPNDTFKGNAGTEVTSDILFLQKRDRVIEVEPEWIYLDTDENGITQNRYFVQHPEMVLGEMVMESTQYGMDSTCRPYPDRSLEEQFAEAIETIQAEISEYEAEELVETEDKSIPADLAVANFSYTLHEGQIYYRENSRMKPVELSVTAANRVKGMIAIRDCVRELIAYQTEGYADSVITDQQKKLNTLYDRFKSKYGLLNARANSTVFSDDNSYPLLCSLEIVAEDGTLERKADMFTKRTIKPHQTVTRVDTASEALSLSLSERAFVDMDYMCSLTGKSVDEIEKELEGVIFRLPDVPGSDTKFVSEDEYLSGNVRQKLKEAILAAEGNEAYRSNVEALKKVQPKDLTASEISVRLGATWIPPKDIEDFVFELLETPNYSRWNIKVRFIKVTGEWNIEGKSVDRGNVKANSMYGTHRANAYRIIEDTLNLRDVRIYDYVEDEYGKKKAILNKKETAIAQGKQDLIKQAFLDWIWKNPERRQRLTADYNERFNAIRPREYDGSHLNFYGMNPEIKLRQHQKNGVARIIYGGNSLLAYVVGAGKTYTMVAAAMECKRLGLCNKSMIVVPNHIIEQFAAEWLQLYPSANLLVSTKKDFETKNRKKFCARIATSDIDAVIIGHSQFEKIPLSVERQERMLREQIQEVVAGIREAKNSRGDRITVKKLEKTKKSLETRLKKLNDQSRKDDVVCFEELGIDRLFVDEADSYKNLYLYTKMRNVGGVAQTEAQKSSDMFMKTRYLDELTGGRGVIFATGTPISNSMVELYTMQRYLQYDTLVQGNLQFFDAWASTFGETVSAIELAPEGTGYRLKTRFAKFYNLPELMMMFREVADIQTADMLNLPVPEAEYRVVTVKPSEMQKDMVLDLGERAERVRGGMVNATEDNMLLITNDGRKLALDQRLVNEMLPDEEESKVNSCVNEVYRFWYDNKEDKLTQLVFCDLSTPKKDESFSVYNDVRNKLIARGVPSEEIAFIHDANTEVRKKNLFSKVRRGAVRVLMGSTFKMGAGTNVQDLIIASHDLDCPWRPRDLEQRAGRIVRQGNKNKKVDIIRYVTEGTFDAYLYQMIENKQKFISQIMTSKSPSRTVEDIDETALSYAEIKALATGNPHIKEKMDLDIQVSKLQLLKQSFLSQKYDMEDKVTKQYPREIKDLTEKIADYEADIALVKAHTPSDREIFPVMQIKEISYDDKQEAGKAIITACKEMKSPDPELIGAYRGLSMELYYNTFSKEFVINLKGKMKHQVSLGTDIHGNITRLDNAIAKFEDNLLRCRERLETTKVQLETAKQEVEKPFQQEEELKEKVARLGELNALLDMDKKDSTLLDAEPDESVEEKEKSSRVLER